MVQSKLAGDHYIWVHTQLKEALHIQLYIDSAPSFMNNEGYPLHSLLSRVLSNNENEVPYLYRTYFHSQQHSSFSEISNYTLSWVHYCRCKPCPYLSNPSRFSINNCRNMIQNREHFLSNSGWSIQRHHHTWVFPISTLAAHPYMQSDFFPLNMSDHHCHMIKKHPLTTSISPICWPFGKGSH